MVIDLPAALMLSSACAPAVAPETLLSIVEVESRFDPLVIGVNGARPRAIRSSTRHEAIGVATALLQRGENLDLGLGQINSSNLGWLGLTVADAFDPCRNLAASAKVLSEAYGRALRAGRDEQSALLAALSQYNTGDQRRGFANGYVAKTIKAAARLVPAIATASKTAGQPQDLAASASPASPAIPSWDVFGQAKARQSGFVITPIAAKGALP